MKNDTIETMVEMNDPDVWRELRDAANERVEAYTEGEIDLTQNELRGLWTTRDLASDTLVHVEREQDDDGDDHVGYTSR